MITYSSTRGGDQDRSFDHVLLEGLARDGGLFIPNEFPTFSKTEIESFKTKPYQDIAHAIMFKFLDGWISANDLTKLIDKAYSNFTHDLDDALRASLIKKRDIPVKLVKFFGSTHSERISKVVSDTVGETVKNSYKSIIISKNLEKNLGEMRDFLFKNVFRKSIARWNENSFNPKLKSIGISTVPFTTSY